MTVLHTQAPLGHERSLDCHTFWARRGKEKTQSGKGSSGPKLYYTDFAHSQKTRGKLFRVCTYKCRLCKYVLVIMKGIYITSFKYFGFKGFETRLFFDLMVAVGTDFPSQKLRVSL